MLDGTESRRGVLYEEIVRLRRRLERNLFGHELFYATVLFDDDCVHC